MTPKDKAIELYNKYKFVYIQNYTSKHEVKECALIAVDEIIESLSRLNVEVLHTEYGNKLIEINGEIRTNYGSHVIYWNKVKNEIDKL